MRALGASWGTAAVAGQGKPGKGAWVGRVGGAVRRGGGGGGGGFAGPFRVRCGAMGHPSPVGRTATHEARRHPASRCRPADV